MKGKAIIYSIVLFFNLTGIGVYALERSFIEHYKNGDFTKAKNSVELALKENTEDGLAYYYLGHINIKLNDLEGAKLAYSDGIKNCPDRIMSGKLSHALRTLLKRTAVTAKKSPSIYSQPLVAENTDAAFPGENPEEFENRLDQRMKEKQEAIVKNLDERIASEERKLGERIAVLRRDEDNEVHMIPYVFVGGSDYKDRVKAVRDSYQKKIDKLHVEFEEWVKRAEKEAEAKIELVTHSRFSLSGHYQSTTGTSRLTPKGSCTHIRNYINFDGYQRPAGQMTTEKMGSLKESKFKLK